MVPTFDGCDDLIGVCFPDEWVWFVVVFFDEAVDGGLEVDDGMEDAALEAPLRQFGEEAVEPRARSRVKRKVKR